MNLLLDTHAFLWFVWNDQRLSAPAKALLTNSIGIGYLSIASCWGIAIKCGLGKLELDVTAEEFIRRELLSNDLELLPISLSHATSVQSMPMHHRDPFDRMLVAQAECESLLLVSCDAVFDSYGVERAW